MGEEGVVGVLTKCRGWVGGERERRRGCEYPPEGACDCEGLGTGSEISGTALESGKRRFSVEVGARAEGAGMSGFSCFTKVGEWWTSEGRESVGMEVAVSSRFVSSSRVFSTFC